MASANCAGPLPPLGSSPRAGSPPIRSLWGYGCAAPTGYREVWACRFGRQRKRHIPPDHDIRCKSFYCEAAAHRDLRELWSLGSSSPFMDRIPCPQAASRRWGKGAARSRGGSVRATHPCAGGSASGSALARLPVRRLFWIPFAGTRRGCFARLVRRCRRYCVFFCARSCPGLIAQRPPRLRSTSCARLLRTAAAVQRHRACPPSYGLAAALRRVCAASHRRGARRECRR